MPVASHRTLSAREGAALLVLSVLWGGSFVFTGVAPAALPASTLVGLRVGLAALILLLVLLPPEFHQGRDI